MNFSHFYSPYYFYLSNNGHLKNTLLIPFFFLLKKLQQSLYKKKFIVIFFYFGKVYVESHILVDLTLSNPNRRNHFSILVTKMVLIYSMVVEPTTNFICYILLVRKIYSLVSSKTIILG